MTYSDLYPALHIRLEANSLVTLVVVKKTPHIFHSVMKSLWLLTKVAARKEKKRVILIK